MAESEVIAQANMLNHPPICAAGRAKTSFCAPCQVSGKGVSLEVVKKAEKEELLVIRIVETDGRHSTAILQVADSGAELIPTNLMEREDGDVIDCTGPITIKLKPFEITSYKIRVKGSMMGMN